MQSSTGPRGAPPGTVAVEDGRRAGPLATRARHGAVGDMDAALIKAYRGLARTIGVSLRGQTVGADGSASA